MREILFRGKRVDNGEWVEGAFYAYYDFKRTIVQILTDRTNGIPDAYEVIPESVSEFTGLTDKNGKKIFEGDIVKDEISRVIYKVFYCVDSAMFIKEGVLRSSLGNTHRLEVIGNIHDNLEPLKEGVNND